MDQDTSLSLHQHLQYLKLVYLALVMCSAMVVLKKSHWEEHGGKQMLKILMKMRRVEKINWWCSRKWHCCIEDATMLTQLLSVQLPWEARQYLPPSEKISGDRNRKTKFFHPSRKICKEIHQSSNLWIYASNKDLIYNGSRYSSNNERSSGVSSGPLMPNPNLK